MYQGTQTVGCALLSKCTDSRDLVDQFDIQDFVSVGVNDFQGRQVILKRLILNPLFDTQARWVLEEVLRIANIDCILFPNENSDQDTINVTTREFIPVKRRRQISYPKGLRDGSPIPEMLPHNLMLFTSAYLYQPKITVNTRIVFIGGSDASISAIERLIYTPHLHFTNLSLVTNESFPPKDEEGYIVKHSCYSDKDLKQVGPDHFVRIIRGSVEKIVREKRKVQLKDGSLVQ